MASQLGDYLDLDIVTFKNPALPVLLTHCCLPPDNLIKPALSSAGVVFAPSQKPPCTLPSQPFFEPLTHPLLAL